MINSVTTNLYTLVVAVFILFYNMQILGLIESTMQTFPLEALNHKKCKQTAKS